MPIGDFRLRSAYGAYPAGTAIAGWVDASFGDGYPRPGLQVDHVILWPRRLTKPGPGWGDDPEAWPVDSVTVPDVDLDLVQVLRAQVGAASQPYAAHRALSVEIFAPAGRKLRFRVGSAAERAGRTDAAEPASVLVIGAGDETAATELQIWRGACVHACTDATEGDAAVDARFEFRLFRKGL